VEKAENGVAIPLDLFEEKDFSTWTKTISWG